jgi:anti-sigma B factor antagonist
MTRDPQNFSHEVETDRTGRTVLRLCGELDMATRPTLTKVLHELQHGGSQEIVVDLRGLSFLDSMGLSALLEAHAAGQDGHRTVSFIAGGRTVHTVFQITRMDER